MKPQLSLEQLLQLMGQRDKKATALEELAKEQAVGQEFLRPGQNRGDLVMGRGDRSQRAAMHGLASTILQRPQGANPASYLSEGMLKGGQLMDDIRSKQKGERMQAGALEVQNAQQKFDDTSGLYKQQQDDLYKEAVNETARARLEYDKGRAARDKVYASQVKDHEETLAELRRASGAATQAKGLAQEMKAIASETSSGLMYQVGSLYRKNAGTRNAIDVMRTRATRLINEGVINALPKGVASDRDIYIMQQGFPDVSKASIGELVEFMEAQARVEEGIAKYNREKVRYMDKNDYSTKGFIEHWENMAAEQGQQKAQTLTSPSGITFTVE